VAKRRAKGEGSIFKEKTGYWCAKIELPDGKQKRKRSKSQRVVREWLQEQRQAIQMNLVIKDDSILFGDYLDYFIEHFVAHSLARSTIHSYRYLIRDHIKPDLGHIRLTKLQPNDLQNLYKLKIESGLSRRTVQYIHAIIRRSLNQAVKLELLYRNPTDAVSPPRPKREPPQTLSAEQAKEFLRSIEDHPYYLIYFLAITTGMRKGELLGLQWEDVDLDRGKLRIKHTLIDIQGKMHIGQPKSDKAKRTITLSSSVREALKEHQLRMERIDGMVFSSNTGAFLSQRNLTRHFHTSLSNLGMNKLPFHSLRHTAATLLLQANVHPRLVQEMLGHSSIVLTLDTYSHVIPDHHEEAAEEMDKLFG
jgi:integrase